jgi:CBS domain-containing protein
MQTLFESMPTEFVTKTVVYDYKTPLTKTLDNIKKLGAVVVMKDGEYYGIVDDRSIFRTRGLNPMDFTKKLSIGKFAKKVPIVDSATSLSRLITYFHEFSAKALPYQDGKRLTGMVKREIALSTILSIHAISKSTAGDVMSAPMVTIASSANLAQAENLMEKNKIARLVVIDDGRLLGLVSQRDVLELYSKPQERLPELKQNSFSLAKVLVKDMMKTPVHTIDFGMPADSAIRQLLEKGISSLVVTRGNRPVGLLTTRDVIESAAASSAKTQSKIILSGLDEYTKEYEDEIRSSVNKLIEKVDKFEKLNVDYVSINVKRSKERNYEMNGRLSLQRRGTVFAHSTGYSLETTLSGLIGTLYKRMREKKETAISNKRESERYYGE